MIHPDHKLMRPDAWSDEELIVACYIYNSDWSYTDKIKRALAHLGRNESSIKFRFGNFDNYKKGTGGFENGGPHARKIWDMYSENPVKMAQLAEKLIENGIVGCQSNSDSELTMMTGSINMEQGSYREYIAKYRVNQNKLRKATLLYSKDACCITGIHDSSFLIASHIKPWSVCTQFEMTDVHNALCLNIFHDKLFDRYRMTVNEFMEIIYDPRLKESIPEKLYHNMIEEYTQIKVNDKNRPDPKYLEYHNNRFSAITGYKI